MECLEHEKILVRRLTAEDLDPVTRLDAKITGRSRGEYFKLKLAQNLAETGIKISLAAEEEGLFVGFLLARVYYGEFGLMEPSAVLDTLGVNPDFQGHGVGQALLRQLNTDLGGLGVDHLRTEVGWDNPGLLTFFQRQGFMPSNRFCLELEIKAGS